MYQLYQTDGFVMKSLAFKEANRRFCIFTEEFGMLWASATGVRELKSKLRYQLQDFSLCHVSLVRGRDSWRITGAEVKENIFSRLKSKKDSLAVLGRVFGLIGRLAPEEGSNISAFHHLKSACTFLFSRNLDIRTLSSFECILVLRILNCFGYLGESPDWALFTKEPVWSEEVVALMDSAKNQAIVTINSSLRESQL